jgi:putative flippase GtrA
MAVGIVGGQGAMTRQLFWFLMVGGAAAATHLGVVMVLVELAGLSPLLANVAGWAVAFCVSFSGHFRLTFSGSGAALGPAARRFLLISFAGFLINQAAYAVALRFSGLSYALLLALVLVGVAVLTFVFSRWWAFRHTAAPAPTTRANPP